MAVFSHTVDVDTERAQNNLRELEARTEQATRAMRDADDAAQRYGDTAGRVGTNAGKLGGILDRLSPGLGELARLTNDGADAFEVATESGGAFARLGVRIGAILPPVAAAVGVLAGAYFTLKTRLDDANEAARVAAERSDAAADAHARVREQALLAAVATGDLSQEEFNRLAAIRTAGDLFADQQQQARERLRTATEEIASLQQQREETEALVESLKDAKQRREDVSLSGEGGILAGTQLTGTAEQLQQAERRLAGLNEQLDAQALAARTAGTQLNVLGAAASRYAEDLTTVANSGSGAAAAVDDVAESVRSLTDALAGVDLATLGRVTGQDLGGGSSAGPFQLQDLSGQVDALAAGDAADRAARRQGVLGAVSTGLNAIANPVSALGLLGPAGGILQGLNAIGGLGAEGVQQQLDSLLDGITGGIEALPQILVDVIPAFVIAVLTELPGALLSLIPNLVSALIEGWRNRRDNGVGGTEAYAANPEVQALLDAQKEAAMDRANPFGAQGADFDVDAYLQENRTDGGGSAQRSSRAATTGRMERARGAARLSMSRSATARGMGAAGVSIQVNQLGPADATQDSYLRTLAQLQDQTTGLRG